MEATKRMYSLDALKFIGSIIIIFVHYQQITGFFMEGGLNFYNGKFYFGYIVEMFFMISGYMVLKSYNNSQDINFQSYIKHKIVRIYPMAMISIIIYVIVAWSYKIIVGKWWLDGATGIWKTFASILLIHQGTVISDITFAPNNPTWYLCVLILCYIVFYCCVWLGKKIGIPYVYLCIAMVFWGIGIVSYGINLPFNNILSARGYCSFFAGVILYKILSKYNEKKLKIYSVIMLLIVSIAFAVDYNEFADNQFFIAIFVIYPAVIILFIKSNILNKIFNYPIFSFLGKVSFEVYLWHFVILFIYYFINEVFLRTLVPSLANMIAFAVIVEAISILIYKFVEVPITKKLIE